MTVPIPTDPLIGTTVSQYEIVAKLGGGGMGVVYKARDLKLGRSVALKFLPPQWSHDEGAKQRFVREAQAASATHHRNICVIHNIDETTDGRLFIVMAYYEGETLKQRLERGPLPIVDVIEIASEIADGLAKAHGQGVVHRDVKPGNLMLTDDGVKILDFGLAKFADALQLTVPGSTIGTVAYMSPEQARGEEADARSDVWSLGIVMYEMLTGSVPFRGTYQEATFHAIKNEPVPSLRAARPDVPETVERIVTKALEKESAARYQNAREPARELKLLAGRTVPLDLQTMEVARPTGIDPAALPKRAPGKGLFSPGRLLAALALLLAVAMGFYFWMTRPIVRTRVAIVPVINQTGFAELDAFRLALTHALVLESSDSSRVRIFSYDRLLETLRRFLGGNADVSSRDAVQALTTASHADLLVIPVLTYENKAWRARAEVKDPSTLNNVIVIETEPVVSSLSKKTAYDLMTALAVRLDEYFTASGPVRLRWLESFRAAFGRPRLAIAARLRDIDAAALFEQGANKFQQLEYAAAREAFERASKADPQSPIALAWLARTSQILQQNDAAQQAAAQAARLLREDTPASDAVLVRAIDAEARHDAGVDGTYRAGIETYPDDPGWLIELAAFHDRLARSSDAIATYQRALAVDNVQPGVHLELCRLYGRTNEPTKAKQEGEIALTAYRSLGNRGGEALALMCLTNVLRLGDPASQDEARRDAGLAVSILEQLDEPYNLARAHYYVALAAESQSPSQAARLYEGALEKARVSGNVVLEPLVLMNLGAMNVYLGRQSQALNYHQQSLALYERFGDERRAAQLQSNVGSILIEYAGKPKEGLRDVENAKEIFRKLGDRDFEIFAAKMTATALRYEGRLADAEHELNRAIELSRERNLTRWVPALRIDLARVRFEQGDYGSAKTFLEQAIGDGSGRDAGLALVTLARIHSRVGEFTNAQNALDRARTVVAQSGMSWLSPALELAGGELAYESGRLRDARGHFESAAALWVDDLPETASVEAKAWSGFLDAIDGRSARGATAVRASLQQAQKMGAYWVQGRSLLLLARVAMLDHRDMEARDSLNRLAADGERVYGPEIQAQAAALRSRLATTADDRQREAGVARKLVEEIQGRLPDAERTAFSGRPDIKFVLESSVPPHDK